MNILNIKAEQAGEHDAIRLYINGVRIGTYQYRLFSTPEMMYQDIRRDCISLKKRKRFDDITFTDIVPEVQLQLTA